LPADAVDSSPLRKLAFYFAVALVFVQVTVLPEVLQSITGVNTYILYVIVPPALLAAVLTGGVKRTFRGRAPYYWVAFFGWMVLATPFSSWVGGSVTLLKDYVRLDLVLLLVVGGLIATWKETRLIFYTIAAGALFNLLIARYFMDTKGDRVSVGIEGFTIGNSNDLAAHLLLVLPFLLFVAMGARRNPLLRFVCFGAIGYGLWIIVGTASRGALLAVAASSVFLLWRASMVQRFATVAVGCVMAVVFAVGLPQATLGRLKTLVGEQNIEADESATSRSYLFRQSVLYTIQHPIFGVGPDQYSNFEGKTSMAEGRHGAWHATHCTFTQVSSECGIPALIFYVGGLASAILLVNRTYQIARQKGYVEIANACFCYLLGMVGFLIAITFLANAYRFYFPLMIGLSVSMSFAAARQMTASSDAGSLEPAHAVRR